MPFAAMDIALPLSKLTPSKKQLFELAQKSNENLKNDFVPYWQYETEIEDWTKHPDHLLQEHRL